MVQRKLNLDVAESVSELEAVMKEVLPKHIMYRLILGKGLEFDGYRGYTSGDDADLIDWKASVRGNNLVVRKFIEERDRKFIFLVDVSENMVFGSTEKVKCEYTAEMVAAISHLILTRGDKIGFALYNDKIVERSDIKSGTRQFEIFVDKLSNPFIYNGRSYLPFVLGNFTETLPGDTSMVFIISDFIKMDEGYIEKLKELSQLYETVAIIVRDPLDVSLPKIDKEVVIENPEDKQRTLINPSIAKGFYEKYALSQLQNIKEIFEDIGIDYIEVRTDSSFVEPFTEFIKDRLIGGRIVKTKNVY